MRTFLSLCLLFLAGHSPQLAAATDPDATPEQLHNAFIAADDLPTRLQRLMELEQQALQLAVDEPLKLGSIGSAILDIYYGSQAGHLAMSRFYEHVDSAEAKAPHDRWLERLQQHMLSTGDGTHEAPYEVMTVYDAHVYAQSQNTSPVGSIYQSSDETHFGFLLVAKPEAGSLRQMFFDLSHVLEGFAEEGEDAPTNPWPFMRLLAGQMDSAAQTAIGAYLTRIKKYDEAVSWLQVASRTGNVLANSLLARIYWTQSEAAEGDEERDELRELSLQNHMHAIALGSTDSMYTLANLYLNDFYGEDNRAAGVPLLQQAGELGHAEALLYLGHLYNTGLHVDQDTERAHDYFASAAELNNPQAILNYGRFLTAGEAQAEVSGQIFDWLEQLADDENAEAMVVLGNLHARGVGTKPSNKRALRWYKRAVRKAPENGDIVNEVAWTLTVSDVDGLQRAKYAKRIMDDLMKSDTDATTRPEYLDTWAAVHAARGNFEHAIELQQQAIAAATDQGRDDVMDILREHLELFKAGTTITEPAP